MLEIKKIRKETVESKKNKMCTYQVFLVLLLICTVRAFPSKETDDENDETDGQSEDYNDRIADIFDTPLNEDQQMDLENCVNIICVPHYLCLNNMVVNDGTELFELRISTRMIVDKSDKLDKICGHLELPCCADEAMKKLHQNEVIDQDESNETDNYTDSSDENEIPTSNEERENTVKKCGYREKTETSTRIIDGDEANPNEFPWMVGIFMQLENGNLRYIGGGSLIHSTVILTAAHILKRSNAVPENLVIRAGDHNILETKEDSKYQERNVKRIIIHEHLYALALINDVALLVLDKPFKLSDTVNTICLPPQSVQTNANIMCTVSGWGKNSDSRDGTYQGTLKKADIPMVKRRKCERILRKTRLGPFYNLDESLMCAGDKGRDSCKGDGGSPLFCKIPYDKNRFYQTGIVAGGIGCGGTVPGLYVNVSHFTQWIFQQLLSININFEEENVLQYDLFD